MFKNIYAYLLAYSAKKVLLRLLITSICFAILIWVDAKNPLGTLNLIAISGFLLWFGVGFSLLFYFVHLIDNKLLNPIFKKVFFIKCQLLLTPNCRINLFPIAMNRNSAMILVYLKIQFELILKLIMTRKMDLEC